MKQGVKPVVTGGGRTGWHWMRQGELGWDGAGP